MNLADPLEALARYLDAGPFGPDGPGSANAIDVHAWRLRKLYAFLHKAGKRLLEHGTEKREAALKMLEQALELEERSAWLLGQALDVARELSVYDDGEAAGGDGCGWADDDHKACLSASNADRAAACAARAPLILAKGDRPCA